MYYRITILEDENVVTWIYSSGAWHLIHTVEDYIDICTTVLIEMLCYNQVIGQWEFSGDFLRRACERDGDLSVLRTDF